MVQNHAAKSAAKNRQTLTGESYAQALSKVNESHGVADLGKTEQSLRADGTPWFETDDLPFCTEEEAISLGLTFPNKEQLAVREEYAKLHAESEEELSDVTAIFSDTRSASPIAITKEKEEWIDPYFSYRSDSDEPHEPGYWSPEY